MSSVEELYADIPAQMRQKAAEAAASMPNGVSEFEAFEQMKSLGWTPKYSLEEGLKRTIELEFCK